MQKDADSNLTINSPKATKNSPTNEIMTLNEPAIKHWNTFDWFKAEICKDENKVLKQVSSLAQLEGAKTQLEDLSKEAKLAYKKQNNKIQKLIDSM